MFVGHKLKPRKGRYDMKENMVKAINEQINFELYSSYLYMGMSVYFKSINLLGFAHWMEVQVKEELAHALKLYHYLSDRGSVPFFEAIPSPEQNWGSAAEVFRKAYQHEKLVTSRFSDLMDIGIRESDHITNMHIQWYLNEQIEEESTTLGISQKLELIKSDVNALLALDKELSTRVFIDPNTPTK